MAFGLPPVFSQSRRSGCGRPTEPTDSAPSGSSTTPGLLPSGAPTEGVRPPAGGLPLPGVVRHLQLAAPGGPVLVPVERANALISVELPGGRAGPPTVTGSSPHDAAQAPNGTVFVANEAGGTVTVLRGDRIVKVFTDSVQPAGMAPVGDSMGMLDVRRNTLTEYDSEQLAIVGSTPAGAGPTHLVADKHGRMIAADTRGDSDPRVCPTVGATGSRQCCSARGPYGITYGATRDRLWVASSGTNEVVGYDMAEPIPRQVLRFATVQNPYTLTRRLVGCSSPGPPAGCCRSSIPRSDVNDRTFGLPTPYDG